MKFLVLITFLIFGTNATAGLISLQTGVDSGATLAAGATDSDWQINTGNGYVDSVVAYPAQICCNMDLITSGAWVTDPSVTANSNSTGWGIGNLVSLHTTFDLSGMDSDTAILSGLWRVADYSRGVYLNGALIAGTDLGNTPTWGSDQTFGNVNSGFNSGINTLEIVGASGNSRWDGFWFNGSVAADNVSVPEPGSLALLGLGLAALCFSRRKGTKA